MKPRLQRKQRGVALLVVLILLVMMSVLAARISQQFCRSIQKTRYQASQQQLYWAMQAQGEAIANVLKDAVSGEDKPLDPKGSWVEPVETRGENYSVESTLHDAQDCFNVNNLQAAEIPAEGTADAPSEKVKAPQQQIVEALLVKAGLSTLNAEEVYGQLVDYVDADDMTASGSQEADAWTGMHPARLPANQMMRSISEIKLLPAFPENAYASVSTMFCALPDAAALVDVNTLQPEKAALLSALFLGTLTEDDAIRLIDSRPEAGWESQKAFEEQLEKQFPATKDVLEQSRAFYTVNSHYFSVSSVGTTDDLTLRVISQIHVDNGSGEVKTWQRRYKIIE
jgi:general secretion pathway protein K